MTAAVAVKSFDPIERVPKPLYRKTLTFVNKIRVAIGLKTIEKLPKGVPNSGQSCPVARALRPRVVFVGDGIKFKTEKDAEKVRKAFRKEVLVDSENYEETQVGFSSDTLDDFIDRFDNFDMYETYG